jgi:hypothetical protein
MPVSPVRKSRICGSSDSKITRVGVHLVLQCSDLAVQINMQRFMRKQLHKLTFLGIAQTWLRVVTASNINGPYGGGP